MKSSLAFLALLAAPALVLAQGAPATVHPAVGATMSTPAVSAPNPTPTVNAANAPKIFCPKPEFDFKTVDEGPDIIHEFHIKNKGKSPLKVTGVSTSCGCTAAMLKKAGTKDEAATLPVDIPPGGRGTVKVTFHTAGRPGDITKIITVASNDPVSQSFQMKIHMLVVREIDLQPDRLYLYNLKHGQPHSSSITVLGKPDMPLSILSAQSTNGVVTVTSVTPYQDVQAKRKGAIVQVDVPVTMAIGSFNDNVSIRTDSAKKPEVSLQVMGEVTGKIQYNPKSLYFAPHQDMPVTISFTLDTPEDLKKFAIRSVSSAKRLVRPSVVKTSVNGADQYYLVVSVVKNLPKDSDGKDQVVVMTNDDEQGKISIDVQASK